MIREMLNAHAMNILMSEDVNEPSLRVRPHRKNRILRQKEKNSESNENFLRMLSGKQGYPTVASPAEHSVRAPRS